MNLLEEYLIQQRLRRWDELIALVPCRANDTILDLGCSTGFVSSLFSRKVNSVIGIDINQEFVDYCLINAKDNTKFICADLNRLPYQELGEINGAWASFSLSYLEDPLDFLSKLYLALSPGSWVAVLDVACFLSGNLGPNSKFYTPVREFEIQSYKSRIYDFNIGAKLEQLLLNSGFTLQYVDNDVNDLELNFDGQVRNDVLPIWEARLKRMHGLRKFLGADYKDFCNEFLDEIQSPTHKKRMNVRFVIARKPGE